jgi:hypothetical protein
MSRGGDWPALVRRGVRQARRRLGQAKRGLGRARDRADALRRSEVRTVGADTVEAGGRQYRLDDPAARHDVAGALIVVVSDPAALVRVAASGVLAGRVTGLTVQVQVAPDWLLLGVQPPALRKSAAEFTWRRDGDGLTVELRWTAPQPVDRALEDALAAVVRPRSWPQTHGLLYGLDRPAWLDGASTWPHGRLGPATDTDPDDQGRPLGAYQVADRATADKTPPVVTAVANPAGRRLVGAATRYQLTDEDGRVLLRTGHGVAARLDPAEGVEAGLLRSGFDKYAVATVDAAPSGMAAHALRSLAACGVVFAAADPSVRAALDDLDLVTVADPADVDDLPGYALSAEAARRMAVTGDAALRRTALNPTGHGGDLAPPPVSIVLSSMRAEHVEDCLGYLAAQTYPALEVVVGLHGYDVPPATVDRWRDRVPFSLRVVPFPTDRPFGAVLGGLSQAADGDFVTKVDDDDHYGPHHVTDLVIAAHTTGADVTAKGARFVHLPDRDETVDREWAAPENFNATPAGGTLLLSRGVLQGAGGWSHSSKHVDLDLLTRVKDAGGVVYRTHALEYVYVRRAKGHTFDTGIDRMLEEARATYPGLPEAIVRPTIAPRVR